MAPPPLPPQPQPYSDPSELPLPILMAMINMFMPPMNKEGEPEPYDIDAQGDYRNAYQDTLTTQADLMNAYVAGLGAVGTGAFEPTVDRELIETPQLDMLRAKAQGSGYEAFVARQGIERRSPDEILAMLTAIATDPAQDIVSPQEAQGIISSLPKGGFDGSGRTNTPMLDSDEPLFDWDKVYSRATALTDPVYAELTATSGPNVEQGEDGRFYRVSETPSPFVDWMHERALPDLREEYSYDWALQNDPTAARAQSNAASDMGQLQDFWTQRKATADDINELRRRGPENERVDQEAMARFIAEQKARPYVSPTSGQGFWGEGGQKVEADNTPYTDWKDPGGWESPFYQAWNPKQAGPGRYSVAPGRGRPVPPRPSTVELPGDLAGARRPRHDYTPQINAMIQNQIRRQQQNIRDQAGMRQKVLDDPTLNPAYHIAAMNQARRQGRTPATDALAQRFAPLRAVGALGPATPWG